MKKNIVIVISIILFSCKANYDHNYIMQCNASNILKEEKKLEIRKKLYVDSIFQTTLKSDNIKSLSNFIRTYPEHVLIDSLKDKRRKLFQNKNHVINSNIDIEDIVSKNPCYIPLYKNIDYIRNQNINFETLYNSEINKKNPYRNRFIVANLNTQDLLGKSKGIKESFMNIETNWEFKDLIEYSEKNNISYDSLRQLSTSFFSNFNVKNRKILQHQLRLYKNYFNKVEKYREKEIDKSFSSYNGYKYTGQYICFCEINKDTILLVAKHITSAKGKTRRRLSTDTITGETKYVYSNQIPTEKNRKYYAAHYRISIKNWETQREYNNEDKYRDSLLGGGNSRVTFFDGKSQLPNFLLMEPDPLYPKSMKMNGIHEGSLSNMSRCMLGTPQSLGCLRTSDFGSKFSRWWTPKFANLFIYYDEERYNVNNIPEDDFHGIKMPFKNRDQGNLFRRWVNLKYPKYAKEIDLEEEGSCENCFIQLAWEKYYLEYLNTKEGKKLNFTQKKKKSKENKKLIESKSIYNITKEKNNFLLEKEYYIVVGCFKNMKGAKFYEGKIKDQNYSTNIFYDKNAECNLVAIGPYKEIKNANHNLPVIKDRIDKESWIYTKIVK